MTTPISLFLPDDAATGALGRALTPLLLPGDLVLLEGDLGAGKTALARSVIRTWAHDPEAEVPSPSFALVQPYTYNGQSLLHADLYRVTDPAELDELGLTDDETAIVLVEWPQNAPTLASNATLTISLSVGEGGTGRNVQIVFADTSRQSRASTQLKAI